MDFVFPENYREINDKNNETVDSPNNANLDGKVNVSENLLSDTNKNKIKNANENMDEDEDKNENVSPFAQYLPKKGGAAFVSIILQLSHATGRLLKT